MRTKWLLIFLLVTFGNVCDAPAQVADIAGILPVIAGSMRSWTK